MIQPALANTQSFKDRMLIQSSEWVAEGIWIRHDPAFSKIGACSFHETRQYCSEAADSLPIRKGWGRHIHSRRPSFSQDFPLPWRRRFTAGRGLLSPLRASLSPSQKPRSSTTTHPSIHPSTHPSAHPTQMARPQLQIHQALPAGSCERQANLMPCNAWPQRWLNEWIE